jgi:hypothetical protein
MRNFEFDHVFDSLTNRHASVELEDGPSHPVDNEEVYTDMVEPLVNDLLDGACCVDDGVRVVDGGMRWDSGDGVEPPPPPFFYPPIHTIFLHVPFTLLHQVSMYRLSATARPAAASRTQ